MSRLGVPVVAIVIGEGGSGGALGLGVANRVYMLENAYYSVISPESCAAIIYRDSGKAAEAARALRMAASDLKSLGLIYGIIPKPPDRAPTHPAHAPQSFNQPIRTALTYPPAPSAQ